MKTTNEEDKPPFAEDDPVCRMFRTILSIWMSHQDNVEEALKNLVLEVDDEQPALVAEPQETTTPKPRKPRAKKSVPPAE